MIIIAFHKLVFKSITFGGLDCHFTDDRLSEAALIKMNNKKECGNYDYRTLFLGE